MPVSKHRKKKPQKKREMSQHANQSGFVAMRHPLSTLPHEAVIKGLVEIGKTHQQEFPKKLAAVESLLLSADPLLTISMLSTYGLFGSIDEAGHVSSGYKGETFNQSHVEFAQALILRIQPTRCSHAFPTPDIIQQLFDLLPKLCDAYRLRRFIQLREDRSDENKGVALIQEELRLHTQAVRNWGYMSKVSGIVKRLCAPIDDVFQTAIGIRAGNLTDLFVYLIRRQEHLVNERLEKMRPAFRETTILGLLRAYHLANPQLENSSAEMVTLAEEPGITVEQMKAMLLSHSDLSLSKTYTFDAESLASGTDISAPSITSALDRLSIGFGDLAEDNPEHFFLTNPAWTKPVIKLTGGQYFCSLPQAFFSFVFPILAELLSGNDSAMKRYEERRAAFLESDIRDLFGKAFPDCEISPGYRWQEGADEFENDLMVRVDSHLILVEAKSHSISWPALRGAPDRAKRHVKELLLEPSMQSLRLETRIRQALVDKDNCFPTFLFHWIRCARYCGYQSLLRISQRSRQRCITLRRRNGYPTIIPSRRASCWLTWKSYSTYSNRRRIRSII